MALTRTEREEFLAEPHIGAFSVVESPQRAPLSVPIWYDYEPGGLLLLLTGRGSRKEAAIKAAGRFTILAERLVPSVRYVSAEGPVVESAVATAEQTRAMAERYLPPEQAEAYLEFAASDHPDSVAIWMRPEHWLSAELGTL